MSGSIKNEAKYKRDDKGNRILPLTGIGIGLKAEHFASLLTRYAGDKDNNIADIDMPPLPDWLEVHPQNYFGNGDRQFGGPLHRWLEQFNKHVPISAHSVGLSLGTADGLNEDELTQLCAFAERYRPALISDHLSWSGNAHDRYPDLLPVPYIRASLDHFVEQIGRAQDALDRRLYIENPSRYLSFTRDEMDEVDFLHLLCERSGCGLLFDINNVEVSAHNIGFDAQDYVNRLNPEYVGQIHLAGHMSEEHPGGDVLKVDNHGSHVSEISWDLYHIFLRRVVGAKPTLVEWDSDLPSLDILLAESAKARAEMVRALDDKEGIDKDVKVAV